MILVVAVLLMRAALWLLWVWFRLFVAVGRCGAGLFRRARTGRQLCHGPPRIQSWQWWHAAGGALAALSQVATPGEAARALRRVNPQPEVVVALHHLATAEGVSVDLAAWALAVADVLVQPARRRRRGVMAKFSDGASVRWNPEGWALAADGVTAEQGRWEYWVDDELALWWSDSDRHAFRSEQTGDGDR